MSESIEELIFMYPHKLSCLELRETFLDGTRAHKESNKIFPFCVADFYDQTEYFWFNSHFIVSTSTGYIRIKGE